MDVIILNTFDMLGGAAKATYRIHRGLNKIGVSCNLLVQGKNTDDQSVAGPSTKLQMVLAKLRPHLDAIASKMYSKREKVLFSPALIPEKVRSKIEKSNPDIVHLFWVTQGFLRIETIKKIKQPIIWTLHDMWPFTGGCHYDQECGRFQQSCGKCPILHSDKEKDLSRRVWERKRKSWQSKKMVIVATSQWLADMARSSSLFQDYRIEVIPNGIDTAIYKPNQKDAARAAFNLPQDKRLILFSASGATTDKRKGYQFLMQALGKLSLSGWETEAELVIIGATESRPLPDIGIKVHYMGYLHDEISQVLLYSAADVLVAPSVQENLANTVMESLACGTPVVAFDIGGMPDMIDHQANGYLATPFKSDDLADGITWVIENEDRHSKLSHQARQTVVERYALKKVANQYLSLYQDILK